MKKQDCVEQGITKSSNAIALNRLPPDVDMVIMYSVYIKDSMRKSMKFKKVIAIQPRLADDVYNQILSAIVDGEITKGERLIQEQIAEAVDVSRTPVREALLRLEQEGILEQRGRKGFSIREISAKEVRDMYGVREAIEGYAASTIAITRTPELLAPIKKSIDAELVSSQANVEEVFLLNRTIHRTIIVQTNNPLLLKMFERIWNGGVSLWLFAATQTGIEEPNPKAHIELFEILANASPDNARQAMVDHIREGLHLHIPQDGAN